MQLDFVEATNRLKLMEEAPAFKRLQRLCADLDLSKLGERNQAAFRTLVLRLPTLPGWAEKSDEQFRIVKDGMQLFEKLESATDAAGKSAPIAAVPWLVKLIATALNVPEDKLPELSQLSLENNIKIRQALLHELGRMDVFAQPSCAFPIVQALTEVDLRWVEVALKLQDALHMENLGIVNEENRACLIASYAHHTDHGSKPLDEVAIHTLGQICRLLAFMEVDGWDIHTLANACRGARNWRHVWLPAKALERWRISREDAAAALSQVSRVEEVSIADPRRIASYLPTREANIALFGDKAFLENLEKLGKNVGIVRGAMQWLETGKHSQAGVTIEPPCSSFKEWVSVNDVTWTERRNAYLSGYKMAPNFVGPQVLDKTRAVLYTKFPPSEEAWKGKIYALNKINWSLDTPSPRRARKFLAAKLEKHKGGNGRPGVGPSKVL